METKELNLKKQEGIADNFSCYGTYDYRSEVCEDCDNRYECHEETREKRESKPKEEKKKRINRALEIDKLIESKDEHIQSLKVQLGKKSKQIQNLNLDLNKKFLMGTNFYVSIHYSTEIMIYLKILQIAKIEARKINKGKRKTYPIHFTTNQIRLAKQLKISRNKARTFLRWLEASGAGYEDVELRSERNQTRTYVLGHREKKWKYWTEPAKAGMHYFYRVCFNLGTKSRKTKTQEFYESEKIRLGIKSVKK